jgi:hypothetical protein
MEKQTIYLIKASKVSFQTLWFEKMLQNEMFLLCHPRGKQA